MLGLLASPTSGFAAKARSTHMPALFAPAGRATIFVYAAFFLGMGAHLPFWPLWLADWGLSEGEVGLYLGAALLVRILGGVAAPWLADLTGARRTALALLAAIACAAFLAHAVTDSRLAIFVLTLATGAAIAGIIPISDALGAATAARHGFAYAHARAFGSLAFLLANLTLGALIVWSGVGIVLWWIVACQLALIVAALRHPGGVRGEEPRPRLTDALALFRARPFLLAGLASAALMAAHAPLYAYGSIHWRAQGLTEETIGALWAFGVAVEVALMFMLGGWLSARLGPWRCFALAGLAGLLRWIAMAGDPGAAALWALQATHALTFAPVHLGVVAFVSAAAPPGLSASAQGMIAAGAGGLAMALATIAAGLIYPLAGGGVFALGAVLSLTGLAAAFALRGSWTGERLAA
jgi:PPP family 3-phenylpropionic acid transporter